MGIFFKSRVPKEDFTEDRIPKRGLFEFLDIYFSRFMKFIGLNFLIVLSNLIYIAVLFFFSPVNAEAFGLALDGVGIGYDMFFRMLFATSVVLFWGGGPVTAGVSYIFRLYKSREHAWIFSDFKDKTKENFKNALIVMAIDIVVLFLLPLAFRFYWGKYTMTPSPVFLIIMGILIVFTVIYTFMHYYMYQMMVRYECKVKELYKNAYILTIVKFPQLLIMTVISLVIFVVPLYFLDVYGFLVLALLTMSLIRFILEFYASKVIEATVEEAESKEKAIDPDRYK